MYFNNKGNTNIDNEFDNHKFNFPHINLNNKNILLLIIGVILLVFGIIFLITLNTKNKVNYFLSINGDELITIYKDNEYIEPGYTARDNKGNDLTKEVIIDSNLDTSTTGDYEIIYTFHDKSLKRYITVTDKPVGATYIYLKGDSTIYLNINDKYIEPGYLVIDSIDSSLTDKVTIYNKIDTSKKGTYQIVYTVTNSTGVTTSAKRTVIVMDGNISLSLDNEGYTNKEVGINIYIMDNYFDYLLLPDGTQIKDKSYTYKVTSNGEYKFISYNKTGKGTESTITVSNIDKEGPTGSCTGKYSENKTTISIKAKDNIGINKYTINGNSYTNNNITINKELSNVTVTIYDKTGNSTNITCTMKKDITNYKPKEELLTISPADGEEMKYWIIIPKGVQSKGPLVMFLHQDGKANRPDLVKALPGVISTDYEGDKFIMVAPVGNVDNWLGDKTVKTLKAILDKTVKDYQIDKSRVYITGVSRGAIGVWNLVNTYPDYFNVAMPISCCSNIDPKNFLHTKVLAISGNSGGDESYYNKCMQANVEKIQAAGGLAEKVTYYGYTHSLSWQLNYRELYDRILNEK